MKNINLFSSFTVTTLLFVAVIFTSFTSSTPTTPEIEDSSKWSLYYLIRDATQPVDPNHRYGHLSVIPSTVRRDPNKTVIVATARYAHTALSKGFNFLSTNTSTEYFRNVKRSNDHSQNHQQQQLLLEDTRINETEEFYAHGFLEGWLTFSEMKNANVTGSWETMLLGAVPQVGEWFENQTRYMREQVRLNTDSGEADPFWSKVGHLFEQMQGIADGYSQRTQERLDWKQIFAANILGTGEVGGVEWHFGQYGQEEKQDNYFSSATAKKKAISPKSLDRLKRLQWKTSLSSSSPSPSMMLGAQGHCTLLVRPVDNDLFASHTTWASFEMCNNRIFKSFEFSHGLWISMSSYPTQISSLDDWYLTKHLWVAETTLWTFNRSLYKDYPFTVVSEFLRVMVANHLAHSGREWSKYFGMFNNGGYDNSYSVLTKSLITSDVLSSKVPSRLPPDSVWVVEQVPHTIVGGDVTDVLNEQGYWGSWNAAWWPEIRKLAGYDEMEKEYGPGYWSLKNYSRAKIFERDAPKVTSIEKMQQIMRYNNFREDPASLILNCSGTKPIDGKCDPPYSSQNVIGNRADLMPPNLGPDQLGPLFSYLNQQDHTATDAKIARFSNWDDDNRRALIISGPPVSEEHDIPPFVFSKSNLFGFQKPSNLVGVPDEINFSWYDVILVPSRGNDNNGDKDGNKTNKARLFVALAGGVFGVCFVLISVMFARRNMLQRELEKAAVRRRKQDEKNRLINNSYSAGVAGGEEETSGYGTITASP